LAEGVDVFPSRSTERERERDFFGNCVPQIAQIVSVALSAFPKQHEFLFAPLMLNMDTISFGVSLSYCTGVRFRPHLDQGLKRYHLLVGIGATAQGERGMYRIYP